MLFEQNRTTNGRPQLGFVYLVFWHLAIRDAGWRLFLKAKKHITMNIVKSVV
jgi:hypothetical protein